MPESFGHYAILDQLGVGGMGTVYRAEDTRTGRVVAIKVLHPQLAADSDYVRRFEQEARIAQGLDSRRIVETLDFGEDGDNRYLVMEYVPGHTLAQIIADDGPLAIERSVDIAINVATALEEAHAKGIVHRDIKPQNIIFTEDGDAKVSDFGIARSLAQQTMTRTGTFMGTPQYMAPDYLAGNVDIRSDIYSLGIVLYEMLTGAVPFTSDTPWAVLEMHRERPPPAAEALRDEVPEWLAAVVARCLAKKQEDRFQEPTELKAALETGSSGTRTTRLYATPTVLEPIPGAVGRGQPPPHRPARLTVPDWWSVRNILVVAAIVAGLIAVVIVLVSIGDSDDSSGDLVVAEPSTSPTDTPTLSPGMTPTPQPATPTPSPDPSPTLREPSTITFGDGTWLVGEEIPSGIWRNNAGQFLCDWKRLAGFSGDTDDTLALGFTLVIETVEIRDTDAAFSSNGCGTWSQVLTPPSSGPSQPFGEGTWIVGSEIAPGRWRNSDSSNECYWTRLSSLDRDIFLGIIDNESSYSIQIVDIQASDAAFSSWRCGTWTRISD